MNSIIIQKHHRIVNMACRWRHVYVMMMSSWFGSYAWVGSGQFIWEKKTCGACWCAWAASLLDVLWRMQSCFMSEFCAVFTRVFFSISSTWWYVQNTIWTIFIFEKKSNTTIKLCYDTNCWGIGGVYDQCSLKTEWS